MRLTFAIPVFLISMAAAMPISGVWGDLDKRQGLLDGVEAASVANALAFSAAQQETASAAALLALEQCLVQARTKGLAAVAAAICNGL